MFIRSGDVQIYTISFGSAPRTFLAIGGWAGSWEVWAETFSLLSQSWRTVGYDHRGAGATVAPVASISLENMVSDVFFVMDTLGIEKCVLGAESAGVVVALLAARQHPERFDGLVLVDGAYYNLKTAKDDEFSASLRRSFSQGVEWFVDACVPEPDSEAIRRWGRQILHRSEPAAALRLLECMYGLDLRADLRQISVPTLVIHGDQDRIIPLASSEFMANQMPQGKLVVIPGAGHVPTVTRPQEVAEAINREWQGEDSSIGSYPPA